MNSAPDPIITDFHSAFKALTFDQIQRWKRVEAGNKSSDQLQWHNRLVGGIPPIKRSDVLKKIGDWIVTTTTQLEAKGHTVSQAGVKELLTPRTLEDVNKAMAAEQLAKWPMNAVQVAAAKLGVKPTASEQAKRAVVAVWMSELCNSHGILVDEWIAAYKANSNADPRDLTGQGVNAAVEVSAEKPAGSGSIFSRGFNKLIRHPLKWLRRVFVTEIGKGIARFMQNILDFTEDLGFLNQFLLKPTGLNVLLTTLREVGDAMVDGSISTFDEKAVAREGADTFSSAGTALMLAAPFLPPPYNVAAAAVGALSQSAAKFINATLDAPLINKALKKQAAAKSAAATAAANNQHKVFNFMNWAHVRGLLKQGWTAFRGGTVWMAGVELPAPNAGRDLPLAVHDAGKWHAIVTLPPDFPLLAEPAAA